MLWLILFFLVPMWTLLKIAVSTKPNAFLPEYELTGSGPTSATAVSRFQPELCARSATPAIATSCAS
jgi:hypothetical protein